MGTRKFGAGVLAIGAFALLVMASGAGGQLSATCTVSALNRTAPLGRGGVGAAERAPLGKEAKELARTLNQELRTKSFLFTIEGAFREDFRSIEEALETN